MPKLALIAAATAPALYAAFNASYPYEAPNVSACIEMVRASIKGPLTAKLASDSGDFPNVVGIAVTRANSAQAELAQCTFSSKRSLIATDLVINGWRPAADRLRTAPTQADATFASE